MIYTAAHHQGAMKTFWLHFWRLLHLSYTVYDTNNSDENGESESNQFSCGP